MRTRRSARARGVGRGLGWLLLVASLVAAVGLQRMAIERQSLIGDAPHHLLAGYQALAHGTNSLNLEHPPLMKVLAAAPLLDVRPVWTLPVTADQVGTEADRLFETPAAAEHVRRHGRTRLLIVIVIPLLIACAALGWRFGGPATGAAMVMIMGLSFCFLPILSVMQTDASVTLGFVLVALAGLRYGRRPSTTTAAFAGVGVGVALASKFSGVLVLPAVAWMLIAARGRSRRQRVGDAAIVGVVALVLLQGAFGLANRRLDPQVSEEGIRLVIRDRSVNHVGDRLRPYEGMLVALHGHSPAAAQWLTGFLSVRAHGAEALYTTYALGHLYSGGRWWYFPVVLLLKLPLAVLLALLAAALSWAAPRFQRRLSLPRETEAEDGRAVVFLAAVALPYAAVAVTSGFNLGLRHLLPTMPILLLPAASWMARRRLRLLLFGTVLLLESLALAPTWMSATNTWWLGDANPTRFVLGNANLDAHQNLVALRETAATRPLDDLTVVHPWISKGELATAFPDAYRLPPDATITPGWYAVAVTLDQYIPALEAGGERARFHLAEAFRRQMPRWVPQWRTIRCGEDHGYVAGSFHLWAVRAEHLATCAAVGARSAVGSEDGGGARDPG